MGEAQSTNRGAPMSGRNDENVGWIFFSLCPGEQANARTGSRCCWQLPQAFLRHAVHVLQSGQRLSRILPQRLFVLAFDAAADDAADESSPRRRHPRLCLPILNPWPYRSALEAGPASGSVTLSYSIREPEPKEPGKNSHPPGLAWKTSGRLPS